VVGGPGGRHSAEVRRHQFNTGQHIGHQAKNWSFHAKLTTEKNMQAIRENKVRLRAYQIWEEEGQPEGEELAHWYRADSELERERDQMQEERDSKPSDVEETESATHAIDAPQAPPTLSSNRTSAKRQRGLPSEEIAVSRQDAVKPSS
jgi:hypothetical protein